jgi:hypothetical protein
MKACFTLRHQPAADPASDMTRYRLGRIWITLSKSVHFVPREVTYHRNVEFEQSWISIISVEAMTSSMRRTWS